MRACGGGGVDDAERLMQHLRRWQASGVLAVNRQALTVKSNQGDTVNRTLLSLACAACLSTSVQPSLAAPAGPHEIEMTWMSIANWYFKIGDVRIVMDGYITRVPGPPFFVASPQFPADQYAYTQGPYLVDVPSVLKVKEALPAGGKLDYILAGHSHFDHTWDTPTWSNLTGAPIIGGLSTCYQATTQGVPDQKCRVVNGGERIDLGHGITMRVVRFNHSGNASNPIQHFARELSGPPVPDRDTGGLRAGVGEDYPNGGGGRAFLFTMDNPGGKISFFVQNSASAFDLDKDIVVDGVNYGSPLGNLAAAMKDAGLTSVDAWIGTGGLAVAQLIVPVIHPKVYIPNHWDGLFNSFWAGMPFPYKDTNLKAYLDQQKIALMPQSQYFDTYRLDVSGVTMKPNHSVKQKLGFPDVQPFSTSMREAVTHFASTAFGDDCGEGPVESAWARTEFAKGWNSGAVPFGPWMTKSSSVAYSETLRQALSRR
jgi:L-ascorbate metabolism protein UlaG (beta-lactamase superfamily)